MTTVMTKGEREDLQRLVRQRVKVLIATAKQKSAELLADFENQMASKFSFDDDRVWREALRVVEPASLTDAASSESQSNLRRP